jgi:hypothetical protein
VVAAGALVLGLATGLATGCSADQSTRSPASGAPSGQATSGDGSSGPEHFQPTDEDREAIRTLLGDRAAALEDGDRVAFLATVDSADSGFVRQQRRLFANLRQLPVETVRYSVDDAAGLMAADLPGDDPVFSPGVLEQVRLDVDAAPVTNQLEDTFVRRDGAWLLGAETVPGKYEADREPQSRPWAGGVAIVAARSSGLLLLVDRDRRAEAPGLADRMASYIRLVAATLRMRPSYDVLVDATTVGETHAMSTVGDTEAAAITFAVTYFDNSDHGRLAGVRIKVNPHTAARTVNDPLVMRHELTHFLTLERLAGAPTWLKEGLAEWASTAPSGLDDLVVDPAAYAHVTQVRRRLPSEGRWGLDPRADYLIARAAVTHLVTSFGLASVFAMAREYRSIEGDDPDVKTDRVLRRVVGITESQLVRATWAGLATLHRG